MMPIFKKKQVSCEAPLPVAGCGSITYEQYENVFDAGFSDIETETVSEKFFYYGFLAGLSFLSCPEGEEMHGKGVLEYAENAYVTCQHDEIAEVMNAALVEAAHSVLDRFGIQGNVIIAGSFGDDEGDDA